MYRDFGRNLGRGLGGPGRRCAARGSGPPGCFRCLRDSRPDLSIGLSRRQAGLRCYCVAAAEQAAQAAASAQQKQQNDGDDADLPASAAVHLAAVSVGAAALGPLGTALWLISLRSGPGRAVHIAALVPALVADRPLTGRLTVGGRVFRLAGYVGFASRRSVLHS